MARNFNETHASLALFRKFSDVNDLRSSPIVSEKSVFTVNKNVQKYFHTFLVA